MTTILHLLNHPHTRQYVRSDVELEVHAFIPLTLKKRFFQLFDLIVIVMVSRAKGSKTKELEFNRILLKPYTMLIDNLNACIKSFFSPFSKSWHLIQTSTTDTTQTRQRRSSSKSAIPITPLIVKPSCHACLITCVMVEFSLPTREDREARFLASKMSIVASFRSWSGKLMKEYDFKLFMECSVVSYQYLVPSLNFLTDVIFFFPFSLCFLSTNRHH